MIPYVQQHIAAGGRAWHVVRHMLGLFQGLPGKRWRQYLSVKGPKAQMMLKRLLRALLSLKMIIKNRYSVAIMTKILVCFVKSVIIFLTTSEESDKTQRPKKLIKNKLSF